MYVLSLLALLFSICNAEYVMLQADGKTDTYTLLAKILGSSPIDGPDCSHPAFGHHITQVHDSELQTSVFSFFMHVKPDNDRCVNLDRQRNEIKVETASSAYMKGQLNDTMKYQWKFKLPSGFKPSPDFCHIHQIKGGDGKSSSGAPLITLTPRAGSPNIIQLIQTDSKGTEKVLAKTNLAPFEGTWVEANEKIKYGHQGSYEISIVRLNSSTTLFSYNAPVIDIWVPDGDGTTFCRPKWGIYRSLKHEQDLRDEQLLFNDFCVAKGNDNCPK